MTEPIGGDNGSCARVRHPHQASAQRRDQGRRATPIGRDCGVDARHPEVRSAPLHIRPEQHTRRRWRLDAAHAHWKRGSPCCLTVALKPAARSVLRCGAGVPNSFISAADGVGAALVESMNKDFGGSPCARSGDGLCRAQRASRESHGAVPAQRAAQRCNALRLARRAGRCALSRYPQCHARTAHRVSSHSVRFRLDRDRKITVSGPRSDAQRSAS